jgi:peptidoglycan LD-endopeptidase LytH
LNRQNAGADLANAAGMATKRLPWRTAAVACLIASALACSVEVLPDTDTSAARTVAGSDSVERGGVTRDSAAGSIDTVPMAPVPDSTPHATAGADRDTSAIAASPSELSALAATLVIPVQGVQPSALHDSYDEARAGHVHRALDIHAPRGTPVVAATDGRVLKLHDSAAGGLMVYQADASDRFILMYGHLDRYAEGLADGMPVRRGQVIGYVGTTGNAPPGTPHLHFVVSRGRPSASWWRGTPVNPYPLLKARGD